MILAATEEKISPTAPKLVAEKRPLASLFRQLGRPDGIKFLPLFTFVLWLVCFTVGAFGLALPYSRPLPPVKQAEPVQAELLNVELTDDPLPPPNAEPPPANALQPPPLSEPISVPKTPPMIAVAEPSPAIAFALPVEGPTRIVEAKQASYSQPTEQTTPAPTTAPAEPLTFGHGEGRQPAPEYPYHAKREGQEGSVTIRFTVGEDGRVLVAEAVSASPWPLLNQAALRVIRERWRFRSGPVRVYEVAILFQLRK